MRQRSDFVQSQLRVSERHRRTKATVAASRAALPMRILHMKPRLQKTGTMMSHDRAKPSLGFLDKTE